MQFDNAGSRHGRIRAIGHFGPEAVGDLATAALAKACSAGLETLLVDFSRLTTSRPLSTTEGYALGKHIARAGAGLRRVAFLLNASHCVETHQFTLAVAANRGLTASAFANEDEALQWLRSA